MTVQEGIEDVETGGILLILVVIGVLVYVIYKYWTDTILPWLKKFFTPQFPGGPPTPGTSETYLGALATVLTSPIRSIESVLEIQPSPDVLPPEDSEENTGGGTAF